MEQYKLNQKHGDTNFQYLETLELSQLESLCSGCGIDTKRGKLSEKLYRNILIRKLRDWNKANIGLEKKKSCKSLKRMYKNTKTVTNCLSYNTCRS